jgi:hypothetical protein
MTAIAWASLVHAIVFIAGCACRYWFFSHFGFVFGRTPDLGGKKSKAGKSRENPYI